MTEQRPGQRCGWCIDGFHDRCVIIVEMGDRRTANNTKVTGPYFWPCKCWDCRPYEGPQDKCVDCQRRGVVVELYRCVDRKDCYKARERARVKARKKELRKAS